MSVNIKRHHYLLSNLYIETRQTVCSEHVKHHLAGISIMGFNNKTLRLPLSTCRSTTSLGKSYDNFSL